MLFLHGRGRARRGRVPLRLCGLSLLWRTPAVEGVSRPLLWWVFAVGGLPAMAIPDAEQSTQKFSPVAFPLLRRLSTPEDPPDLGGCHRWDDGLQGALALVIFLDALHPLTSTLRPEDRASDRARTRRDTV